jgi:hypothetical protein
VTQGLSASLFTFSYTQQTERIIIEKNNLVVLVNKIVSCTPEPVQLIWLYVCSLRA